MQNIEFTNIENRNNWVNKRYPDRTNTKTEGVYSIKGGTLTVEGLNITVKPN